MVGSLEGLCRNLVKASGEFGVDVLWWFWEGDGLWLGDSKGAGKGGLRLKFP